MKDDRPKKDTGLNEAATTTNLHREWSRLNPARKRELEKATAAERDLLIAYWAQVLPQGREHAVVTALACIPAATLTAAETSELLKLSAAIDRFRKLDSDIATLKKSLQEALRELKNTRLSLSRSTKPHDLNVTDDRFYTKLDWLDRAIGKRLERVLDIAADHATILTKHVAKALLQPVPKKRYKKDERGGSKDIRYEVVKALRAGGYQNAEIVDLVDLGLGDASQDVRLHRLVEFMRQREPKAD